MTGTTEGFKVLLLLTNLHPDVILNTKQKSSVRIMAPLFNVSSEKVSYVV